MDKVIITVAPTGNVPTKDINLFTPITPEEIAKDVYLCYKKGASVAHIHARDDMGKPTSDKEVFREIATKIKEYCDIVIQFSTGARGGKLEGRKACLALKPEMASLSVGSSNFPNSVNYNPPSFIEDLAQEMIRFNIKPEIEIFDLSMVDNAIYLISKGLIKEPAHFNLVLNVPGSLKGHPENLLLLKQRLPGNSTWSVSAIGRSHHNLSAMGLLLGGNVRVGLEDVVEIEKGKPVSNVELVDRIVGLSRELGRDIASPAETRQILALS